MIRFSSLSEYILNFYSSSKLEQSHHLLLFFLVIVLIVHTGYGEYH